jgi:hypothetical protein
VDSPRDAGPVPAAFVAHDAKQRTDLLFWLGCALEREGVVSYLAEQADEGPDTSLYLFSLFEAGWSGGYRQGHERGYEDGARAVYNQNADGVARRVEAARDARKRAKAARRRNRKAGKR